MSWVCSTYWRTVGTLYKRMFCAECDMQVKNTRRHCLREATLRVGFANDGANVLPEPHLETGRHR